MLIYALGINRNTLMRSRDQTPEGESADSASDPDLAHAHLGETMLHDIDKISLDELFTLYAEKLEQLRILDQSLKTTARAQKSIAELIGSLRAANDNQRPASITVEDIERRIVSQLASQPDDLYQLRPVYFEQLVCTLLADMGLEVQLTPQTRDGGRDILAVANTPFGQLLTIVECKKYAPHNKISVNELRSFLFTIRERDRASCGLFATTSFFSRDANKLAADYSYQLKLRDFGGLKDWLNRYGTWTESERVGLWLPKSAVGQAPRGSGDT
jgi:restriction endonuclease Mrr